MKSREIREIPISSLVFDGEIYPRLKIDPSNIRQLAEKIESGITIDPLVIEAKTNRLIDGVHRWKAYQRLKIKQTKCLIFEYANDGEACRHAAQLNVHHGCRLNRADLAMIIDKLTNHGLQQTEIQEILGLTRESYEHLSTSFGYRHGKLSPKTSIPLSEELNRRVYLKANLQHLKGKQLSKKQIEGADKTIGLQQVAIVNQTINMLENDLADWSNELLIERLKMLAALIKEKLPKD